jgi:hypothetical protein
MLSITGLFFTECEPYLNVVSKLAKLIDAISWVVMVCVQYNFLKEPSQTDS